MLAGSGDIGRYTSPGAKIAAVLPAPYESVRVEQAMIDDDIPAAHDGATTSVFVRVQATQADSTLRLEYLLTLTSRAQRWEITAIDGAPTSKLPSSTSPAPTEPDPPGIAAPHGTAEEGKPQAHNPSPTHP